jgi:hypothetical protein
MAGAISGPVPPTPLDRRERGRFVAVVRFGESNVSRNTRMTPDFKMGRARDRARPPSRDAVRRVRQHRLRLGYFW